MHLLNLPAELIADIISNLDLLSLRNVSYTCNQLRTICADEVLNPWHARLLTVLKHEEPEEEFKFVQHLSCYPCIPRRNWLYILTTASPDFILFNDIPYLPDSTWEEAFKTRFLPSWAKWKRDDSWKKTFRLILMRIYHRLNAPCTADEAWTNYIILSRQGIVNLNAASSRQYNPHAVLNVYKEQNNLANHPSTVRLVVQLADVRVIAIGALGDPTSYQINRLAKEFIQPSGIHPPGATPIEDSPNYETPSSAFSDTYYDAQINLPSGTGIPITRSLTLDSSPPTKRSMWQRFRSGSSTRNTSPILDSVQTNYEFLQPASRKTKNSSDYGRLVQPQPIESHREFPRYTPGGHDLRWPPSYDGITEECWVGPMLVTAILVDHSEEPLEGDGASEILRRVGAGRHRWASFTADDLDVIAPWLDTYIEKRVEGMGLGI